MSASLEVIPPKDRIELGNGHYADPLSCYAHPEEGITHYEEWHPRPDNGEMCVGMVAIKRHGHGKRSDGSPQPEWDRVSEHPLTLTPSILCRVCGNHGYIRENQWVEA